MSQKTRFLNRFTFAALAFLILGLSVRAQTSTSFKVTGPCVSCGAAYLEELAMGLNGIQNASYDKDNFMLSLQYDAGVVSEMDIQLELAMEGYDAGRFSHDADAVLPDCAKSGMSRGDEEALGLMELEEDDASSWDSPQNLAEMEALGRRWDDDSEINDENLLNEELDDDGEELLKWDEVDLELDDLEEVDDPEDGNP